MWHRYNQGLWVQRCSIQWIFMRLTVGLYSRLSSTIGDVPISSYCCCHEAAAAAAARPQPRNQCSRRFCSTSLYFKGSELTEDVWQILFLPPPQNLFCLHSRGGKYVGLLCWTQRYHQRLGISTGLTKLKARLLKSWVFWVIKDISAFDVCCGHYVHVL